MKFLIARTDRIGDVVLALPIAEVLKEKFPDCEVDFMVSGRVRKLLEHQPHIDGIITYNNDGVKETVKMLKEEQFDIAILVHPTLRIALSVFLSHIPKRVGTGYRWFSFLLNRRVYEHRQPSLKHEVEYNLGLLKAIGVTRTTKKPLIFVKETEKKRAIDFLKSCGVDTDNFIVVHPGSGGSTLSYPEKNFKRLIKLIRERLGYNVVITGGKMERKKAESIMEGCGSGVVNIAGRTDLRELAAIISLTRMFISIGTGPMHIASAVNTRVVAFFPPSRVTRKMRWRPLSDAIIFEPPVPYCNRCIGERCKYYNCLSLISPEEVVERIKEWERQVKSEKQITDKR